MSFKSLAEKILGESIEFKTIENIVENVEENTIESPTIDVVVDKPIVDSKTELNFVGSFNYVPDPIEYNEGSIYKNVNEGVAYIRKGLLWEELVRDGKPGRDAARVGGSGVGVAEVKTLINNQTFGKLNLLQNITSNITSATISDLKSFDDSYNFNIVGIKVEGPSTGSYSAQIKIYTYENSTFKLAATSVITNTNNVDGTIMLSENKQWCADLTVLTGTIPSPGVVVKVVL